MEKGWVIIAEKPFFITTESKHVANTTNENSTIVMDTKVDPKHAVTKSTKRNIFILKRLNVRDGSHGYFRHIALIPAETKRPIILTFGRYEVTEILGYDKQHDFIYFMAAPERMPGQRQLYRANLTLDESIELMSMNAKNVLVNCISCEDSYYSSFSYFKAPNETSTHFDIPNNCLYNKIYFNSDYTYYVQECLGPESPSSYIVNTITGKKIFILDNGNYLRDMLIDFAKPQIMTFSVQIKYDFNAQVKLFLPPGIKEEDDMLLPLILQVYVCPNKV